MIRLSLSLINNSGCFMGNCDKVLKERAFTSRPVTEIDILKDHLFCIEQDGGIFILKGNCQ